MPDRPPPSPKPLRDRLQVKGERRLAVIDPPAGWDGVADAPSAPLAEAAVVLLFAGTRAELDRRLPGCLSTMAPGAILWLAYPKLTSPLAVDLSRDIVHALAPGHGLDTVAQIAIDADWSALRLKRID